MDTTHRQIVGWQENGAAFQAACAPDSRNPPPKQLQAASQIGADAALRLQHQGTGLVWRGDFHQGKQLLAAVKKRVHAKAAVVDDFHRHRLQQMQQNRLFHMIFLVVEPGFVLTNPRAPDVRAAMRDVYGADNTETWLVPLHRLLGFIGAHEWHKTGVAVSALDGGRIHVPYGVFSPVRGEYVDLVAQAALPENCRTAWDIGTGSGVLAAVLARRGVTQVVGTDNNPRAVACAQANMARLGLAAQVQIVQQDFFPEGQADLIVCNPPWLPAKPTADIETALYDPDSAMLRGFLNGVAAHLRPHGEVWLVMSDLAEHLGLRAPDALPQWMTEAGWMVAERLDTRPNHAKARNGSDPLAAARQKETTSLWRLRLPEKP